MLKLTQILFDTLGKVAEEQPILINEWKFAAPHGDNHSQITFSDGHWVYVKESLDRIAAMTSPLTALPPSRYAPVMPLDEYKDALDNTLILDEYDDLQDTN